MMWRERVIRRGDPRRLFSYSKRLIVLGPDRARLIEYRLRRLVSVEPLSVSVAMLEDSEPRRVIAAAVWRARRALREAVAIRLGRGESS
jgi:predicted nicotinamide N-methyase